MLSLGRPGALKPKATKASSRKARLQARLQRRSARHLGGEPLRRQGPGLGLRRFAETLQDLAPDLLGSRRRSTRLCHSHQSNVRASRIVLAIP